MSSATSPQDFPELCGDSDLLCMSGSFKLASQEGMPLTTTTCRLLKFGSHYPIISAPGTTQPESSLPFAIVQERKERKESLSQSLPGSFRKGRGALDMSLFKKKKKQLSEMQVKVVICFLFITDIF